MFYNVDTFLKPISTEDKNLLLFNNDGVLTYTLNPFSINNIQVRGNIITISIKSGRTILLDFKSSVLAKNALPILQERIFTLTEKTPNFIDKQIENWVSDYIGATGGYNQFSPSFYGTVSIYGTLSMDGNIIPSLDYTWDLGSTQSRWNNIYVKDALVASQSIYLGEYKMSTKDGVLVWNDIAVNKYDATSETFLPIPNVDEIVTLTTQTGLSYKYGDTLKVFNKEQNYTEADDYSVDTIYAYFVGRVDNYNPSSGLLTLVVNHSFQVGLTFSFWHIKLNTDVLSPNITEFGTVSVTGNIIPSLDYTWDLGSSQSRWNNIYVKDALVASQSLFLGDIKISSKDNVLLTNNVAISKYEGTSETFLSTPTVGNIVTLNTQTNLSYKFGDTLKVYNKEENFTEEDDYSEDNVYSYFLGRVDNYNPNTGSLTLAVNLSYNPGLTFSYWFIKLNTDVVNPFSDDIELPEGKHLYSGGLRFSSRITGSSSNTLTVLSTGYYFELTTQKYLSFERGISVIVSNGLEDFYVDDDYFDDANAAVMFCIVDSYVETTGVLGLYVEKSIGLGRTASSWSINISGRQSVQGTTASFSELTVTGTTNLQQVIEVLTTATATGLSPSTYELDFNDGSIFYIEPEGDNFVASYLNVPTTDNRIISTTIIISQTSSAYIPNVVSINGDIIPISWANGSLPSGNANQTDIVGFSFVRIGATWSKVFGQLSAFATI